MKFSLTLIAGFLFYSSTFAQTTPGPAEKAVTDTICNCLARLDLSKINNKADATAAFTDCFSKRMDLLMQVADERHVDATDMPAMKQLGIDIGKDLLNSNCGSFTKLALKMAGGGNTEDAVDNQGTSEGKLKRMELKGFNYIIITDDANSEKSFIWLKQFPGSEKFMNGVAEFTGKKVKIKWDEIEVYLPQAKGYYKVKEITAIELL